MTYNVFGGMLSLTQSIDLLAILCRLSRPGEPTLPDVVSVMQHLQSRTHFLRWHLEVVY